jgi:DNA-binding transcriptional LysR family regulator
MIVGGTVCVVQKRHKLAKRKEISVQDLNGEPLILLGKGCSSREQINRAFTNAKIRMKVRIETHTVGAACAFARGGSGIAIVNELFAKQFSDESIVLRRFLPNVKHEYAFVTSKEAPMSRVTRQFYDHCLNFFETCPRASAIGGHRHTIRELYQQSIAVGSRMGNTTLDM